MKNNSFKRAVLLGIVLAAGWFLGRSIQGPIQKVTIRGHDFQVEIADTPEKRELGLGERNSLCQECALLFVFPEKEKSSFWMKGMRFPLDILWIDSADGRIVHLEKNIPADSKAVFTPDAPADRVLELNGGSAERYGIQTGERVDFQP